MQTDIDICNAALQFLGQSNTISRFDEGSEEARLCSLFYPSCKKIVLARPNFFLGFTESVVKLNKIEDESKKLQGWNLQYQLPSNVLRALQVFSTSSVYSNEVIINLEYIIRNKIIYTRDNFISNGDVYLRFDDLETEVSDMPEEIKFALMYYLATLICNRFLNGREAQLKYSEAYQQFQLNMNAGYANIATQNNAGKNLPTFLRVRGYR